MFTVLPRHLKPCIPLQGKHGGTRAHGDEEVRADGEVTEGEGGPVGGGHGNRRRRGLAAGRRGARGAGPGGSGGGDGVGAGRAGQLGLAGARRGRGLGGGLAREVARVRGGVLADEVLVEDVSELLLGVAHAVGAVDTRGRVVKNARAVARVLTADVSVQVTVVAALQVRRADAPKRVEHAVTEVRVGRRGQDISRLPRVTDGGARGGRVGRAVGSHGHGAGGDGLDAGAERGVVLHDGDGRGVNLADQTWERGKHVSSWNPSLVWICRFKHGRGKGADSP